MTGDKLATRSRSGPGRTVSRQAAGKLQQDAQRHRQRWTVITMMLPSGMPKTGDAVLEGIIQDVLETLEPGDLKGKFRDKQQK